MTQTKEQKLKLKSLAGVAEFMDSKVRDIKFEMRRNRTLMKSLHEKQFELKRQLVKLETLANTLRK